MSLTADSTLELQDPDNGIYFEVAQGGLDDAPAVRGDNVVIPGKPGQTHMTKVEDHLLVTLHGYVEGQGATAAEQRVDYRALMDSIKAVFDPTAEPFDLVATGGEPYYNEGLDTGETATITVEFLRFTGPPGNGVAREFDIECRCISDPPAWVIGS